MWLVGACVVNEDTLSAVEQAGISPNGISPNGISPNGISPNGISPNGISPNGISPNGISPNGVTLNGISPNGISPNGAPLGIAGTGTPLSGAGLVGSTWTGHLSSGGTVTLRLDEARRLTGDNDDVWSYRIAVSADGTFRPLCEDASGNQLFAITVSGTWNLAHGVAGGGSYDAATADFSLACRGSAIAKCVELGYKPWHAHQRELATCVRALRGDYCGDGVPYTVDGRLVNIYDAAGIQADVAGWDAEAEWTPDGASCVSKKKETRFWQAAHERPSCFPQALKPKNSCGSEFQPGIAIITELPPQ